MGLKKYLGTKMVINLRKRLTTACVWLKKNWHWGNFITLLALIYSVWQGAQNNADNNKELVRISRRDSLGTIRDSMRTIRDSIRSFRDSVQTETLIREYSNQVEESKSRRKSDSSQLSSFIEYLGLTNKSLKAQNRSISLQTSALEVQRLTEQSDLQFTVSMEPVPLYRHSAGVHPIFTVINRGKSTAEIVGVEYFITPTINWNLGNFGECQIHSYNSVSNYNLKPEETAILKSISYVIKVVSDSIQLQARVSKLNALNKSLNDKKVSNDFYNKEYIRIEAQYPAVGSFYMVSKLSYIDKFSKTPYQTYHANLISAQAVVGDGEKIYFNVEALESLDSPTIKKCALKYGFDFNLLIEAVNKQKKNKGFTLNINSK